MLLGKHSEPMKMEADEVGQSDSGRGEGQDDLYSEPKATLRWRANVMQSGTCRGPLQGALSGSAWSGPTQSLVHVGICMTSDLPNAVIKATA